MMKEATCIDSITGVRVPLVHLPPEDTSCHASALSTAPSRLNRTSVVLVSVLLVIIEIIVEC